MPPSKGWLDVTYVEPCPPESPLWTEENVILTSHSAGASQHIRRRAMELFVDNLHRYVVGEVDRLQRKYRSSDAKPGTGMDRRDILADNPIFIDVIVELMGPYIQLSMAEATVRAPARTVYGPTAASVGRPGRGMEAGSLFL